jgi:putative heme iron utilization protein
LAKTAKGSTQYNNLLAIRNEEASRLIELETELGSVMSESITKAAEIYEQNVDRIMETMKDAMAGLNYGSLDDLQTAYDRAEETAGRFLDITRQEYELSKLRRNIN